MTSPTPSYLLQTSAYHHPTPTLSDPSKHPAVNQILDQFLIPLSSFSRLQAAFTSELNAGLSSSPTQQSSSSLLMINTFVPSLNTLPNRSDLAGDYISLDIGSSNFRVLYNKLRPTNSAPSTGNQDPTQGDQDQFIVQYYEIPAELRKGACARLFDFLATCIASFLSANLATNSSSSSGNSAILPLGFTFSFPMAQFAIDSGTLKTWTKNFDLPDAVNADVAVLLQRSLDALGNVHNVRVVALLNDSTGTLVKGSYIDGDCAIGLILGTGSNAAYLEATNRIEKWTTKSEKYSSIEEVIVNMECGAFGDNGCIDFVRTEYDRRLDSGSLFPNSFTFEKYVGGHFLGEILRLVLVDLTTAGVLFSGVISPQLSTADSVQTKDLSLIEGPEGTQAATALAQTLGYPSPSTDDVTIIQLAASRISIRVATLLSALLSTLVRRMGKRRTVIAVDGSVFRKHPKMRQLMGDFIGELLKDDGTGCREFELIEAEDGSGKGAGIAAAVASKLGLFGQ